MKEWLTAQELADEALPDFPGTRWGVQLVAERLEWNDSLAYARRRSGRGGGFEYNIALLPTLARIEYEKRHRKIEQLELPIAEAAASDLTGRGREERDARLAIVSAYEKFARGQQLSQASLFQIFVDRFNTGKTPVDAWVRERIGRLSKRSLHRWKLTKDAARTDALAVDRSAARAGTGLLDVAEGGRVRTFILGAIAQQPHLSAANLRKLIRSEFGDTIRDRAGVAQPVPPVRTLQTVMKRLKETEKVALTKLTNPDFYRSTMAPRGTGSLRHVTEANQLWQIDASPVDALCTDGRHAIYACIDIATRRTLFYVSKTPRASAVAMLIRLAILRWGAPTAIKTDNGSDFVARDVKNLFLNLDIEPQVSDAYQPQQKGHVERVIGTFQREFATLLPGYVGHSVADRKAIEDRKSFADRLGAETADLFDVRLSGPELQAFVDDWSTVTYERRPHSGLNGLSPFEAAARCLARKRTVDARALDMLIMPVAEGGGVRTVQATGIRIAGYHYVINQALPGDRVLVRMDPNDSGRAYAFDVASGRFVGEAICAELAGVDPKKLLATKRAMQAEVIDLRMGEAKKEAKRLAKGRALIERTIEVDRRDMEAANIVAFPKREETHTTPAIEAALDAARVAQQAPAVDPEIAAEQARIEAEFDPERLRAVERSLREKYQARLGEVEEARTAHLPETVVALPELPIERFRRAVLIRDAVEAGEAVNSFDAIWMDRYEHTPEWKGLNTIFEIEGRDWLFNT